MKIMGNKTGNIFAIGAMAIANYVKPLWKFDSILIFVVASSFQTFPKDLKPFLDDLFFCICLNCPPAELFYLFYFLSELHHRFVGWVQLYFVFAYLYCILLRLCQYFLPFSRSQILEQYFSLLKSVCTREDHSFHFHLRSTFTVPQKGPEFLFFYVGFGEEAGLVGMIFTLGFEPLWREFELFEEGTVEDGNGVRVPFRHILK